jgi:hypothetical protein
MWLKEICPICGDKLVETAREYLSSLEDAKITTRCINIDLKTELNIRFRYHFENVRMSGQVPYFEMILVFPYVVESYVDLTNIAQFDEKCLLHHIMEISEYLELPWYDLEKVRNKLKTIILFK